MLDLNDVGYLVVRVRPAGAAPTDPPAEVKIDLWNVQNRLWDLGKQHEQGSAIAYHEAVRKLMQELGLPGGSDYLCDQFVLKVNEAVLALKNSPAGESSPATA